MHYLQKLLLVWCKGMLDNLEEMIATIERASNQILSKIGGPIECLLMLGTGLGSIANRVEVEFRFSYKEIPGFPVSTAPTHEGNLIIGKIGSKRLQLCKDDFTFMRLDPFSNSHAHSSYKKTWRDPLSSYKCRRRPKHGI